MASRAQDTYVLGSHIIIQGATGSGKSTLANRLGEALGLEVMHLDNIRHERGFDSVDWDEMRRRMEAFVRSHTDGCGCATATTAASTKSRSRAATR